jgi:hypothetical protein
MTNIQIVKLQNGDDLIANVSILNNGETYIISEPMLFGLEGVRNGQPHLLLKHYLPVQLLKKNEMCIKAEEVFSVLEPDEEFAEFYQHTVSKLQKLLKAKDDLTNDEANDFNLYESILEDFDELKASGHMVH